MKEMKAILAQHSFFRGLKGGYLDNIADCASYAEFNEEDIILKEGGPADYFYLIREGLVAIETLVGESRSITIQTIGKNDILGWSWLIPPHRSRFNCRAVKHTTAIKFDGKGLREKCEKDCGLGYEILANGWRRRGSCFWICTARAPGSSEY
ncbi:MAG: cyclic nucleotide-binding domain-containing protein [Candidatus Omnitrophica bacterium]|nr:cyclic nucleotide-binding domain-containing protein [Candidatus Omnitrophota bacterium]